MYNTLVESIEVNFMHLIWSSGCYSLCINLNPYPAERNHSLIYANSMDPDETPSTASHTDPSCLTLRHFHIFFIF